MDITRDEWASMTSEERGACILTTNALNKGGYGRTSARRFGRKINYTHVLAWIDAHGCLPHEDQPKILHHCDTPSCINPRHLFAGTQKDNMQDCAAKNRTTRLTYCGKHETERVLRGDGSSKCLGCEREYKAEWNSRNPGKSGEYALKYYHDKGRDARRERMKVGGSN